MDTSKPNIARVYDYWLGGKDNYAADRDVAGRMLAHDPGLRDRVRDNREFVTGVARQAAERGSPSSSTSARGCRRIRRCTRQPGR